MDIRPIDVEMTDTSGCRSEWYWSLTTLIFAAVVVADGIDHLDDVFCDPPIKKNIRV